MEQNKGEGLASPALQDRATHEPNPSVSALRVGIADAERGPEWEEMEARHAREGVVYFHASRAHPDVTDEQVAAEMNRIARLMENPHYRTASALRGHAFLLGDSAACRSWNGVDFEPVEPEPLERIRAEDDQRFATLLIEAAVLLEAASGLAPLATGE